MLIALSTENTTDSLYLSLESGYFDPSIGKGMQSGSENPSNHTNIMVTSHQNNGLQDLGNKQWLVQVGWVSLSSKAR